MHLIPFSESEPHRQSRVDPNRRTISNVEIATAEITGDGGCFFLGEVARAFTWSESGSRCAGECTIVVVIMLLREVGLDVGETDGRREAGNCWG
jgi:hypothetical protein